MKMKKVNENIGAGMAAIKPMFTGVPRAGILNQLKPYDYSIKPLNKTLEPNIPMSDEHPINISIGDFIEGKKFKTSDGNDVYSGTVTDIVKSDNGNIIEYVIQSFDTSTLISLDPKTVSLYKENHKEIGDNFNSVNTPNGHTNPYQAKKIGRIY